MPQNPPTILISLPLTLIYNAPSVAAAATAAAFLSDPGRDGGTLLGARGEQRIGSSSSIIKSSSIKSSSISNSSSNSNGGGIGDEDEG